MESYVVKSIDLEYCTPAKLEDDLTLKQIAVFKQSSNYNFFSLLLIKKMIHSFAREMVEVCLYTIMIGKPKAFPDSLLNLIGKLIWNEFSIIDLFLQASLIVQLVMVLLLVGFSLSWIVIFERYFNLNRIKAANKAFEEQFWSGEDLNELFEIH